VGGELVIHLELKETIYIVQEGNVNLLTKLKGILGYWNVKGMEKPTWTNEISLTVHDPTIFFQH
jgi:hypothetical protein